jgi:hypothetical protein
MDSELQEAASPKPRHRWFQFSLRTLMIFTLACAVGCAWFAAKLNRARLQ